MRIRSSILVIVLALVLLFTASYFAVTLTREKISEPEKDVLVVGTNTPFPPFELRQGEDVVGFDIDLIQEVAKSLGKKLVIKDFNEFDALLPALQTGSLDLVISAVTIRQDRDEVVDFSQPYYDASQGILTKKGGKFTTSGVFRPEDFKGMQVAYQEGTTSQFWVEENILGKVELAGQTVFDDFSFAIQLLRLGSIDVIILDKPVAESFAKSSPDLVIAGTIETGEQYGIVVQEGDPENLLPAINKVIAELKEKGEYQKLLEKWFGGEK